MAKLIMMLPLVVLVAGVGCGLFPTGGGAEIVLASTAIGTPVGNRIEKQIGPAGGTLASNDGRLTLTVPPDAVAEPTTFSILPITNQVGSGSGPGYRLEPNGMKFSVPVRLALRYDDMDLSGTIPEAFGLAWQDSKGTWHVERSVRLDTAARTVTLDIGHFTDFALLARLRMNPTEAKVLVGESIFIGLIDCPEPSLMDRIRSVPVNCASAPRNTANWRVVGQGTIERNLHGTGVKYTAPAKRPTPNEAWVYLDVEFDLWDPATGSVTKKSRTFATKITIVSNGYKAEGSFGPNRFSGTICDIDASFTVETSNPFMPKFTFTPTSENGGAWSYPYVGVTGQGAGTYTLAGPPGERTAIIITGVGSVVAPVAGSGGGTVRIGLTPLSQEEDCGG